MNAESIPESVTEDDEIPGQMEITKDMPEYCPQFMNEPEETGQNQIAPAQITTENTEREADFQEVEDPEKMVRPYGTRKP